MAVIRVVFFVQGVKTHCYLAYTALPGSTTQPNLSTNHVYHKLASSTLGMQVIQILKRPKSQAGLDLN
jgi:hypothetical protein